MKTTPFNQFEQQGNIDPTLVDIAVARWNEGTEAAAAVFQVPGEE